MEDLLLYLVKSIVRFPEKVEVLARAAEKLEEISFVLSVAPEDMGVVIGKEGRTIRAIRTILNLKAYQEKKRVFLILEEKQLREIKKTS